VLRLNLRSTTGDAPTLAMAKYFRFCADGTLRGPENYVVARREDGFWRMSGRMHREIDCEGPVTVRLSRGAHQAAQLLGPFAHLHTVAGVLHSGQDSLHILVPGGRPGGPDDCHELTLLSGG